MSMYRQLLLIIILLTTACTTLPNNAQTTGPLSSLANHSSDNRIDFSNAQLSVTIDELSLDAGESTEFLIDAKLGEKFDMRIEADPELQIANAAFNPAGELLMSGHGRALDWRSTRTTRGDFRVQITNENESAISYALRVRRTLPTVDQIKLDDLLAKFNAADITVTHAPSVQRPTEFDELYGEEIATREILRLTEPWHRVDVYIFADEATAAEAATLIEPGSNRLTRTMDGVTKVVELYADSGSSPLWWQTGPFLLYSASPEPIVSEQVGTALGDPLGKLATDSVNVRLRNDSDAAWQDVTLQVEDESIVIGELVSGVSGYRELPTDQAVMVSVTHDGETYNAQIEPLTVGSYIIDLILNEDDLLARPFQDQEYFASVELIDVTWTWQRVEYADSSTYTPYTSPTFSPTLKFGTATTPNFGEAGQLYSGNWGCNGMGGLYFVNEYNEFLALGGGSTMMFCGEAEMESESIGATLLSAAHRFERIDNELHLITLAGDRMIFTPQAEILADAQIYLDIINGWGGTNTPFLVVAETKSRPSGISEAEASAGIQALFPDRGEPSTTLSTESIETFFLQQTGDAVKIELPNDDIQLISKSELEALFADGDEAGWQAIQEQYPGVGVIFAFSDVGFFGDKALVYYEVWTGGSIAPYYSIRFKTDDSWQGNMTSLFGFQE